MKCLAADICMIHRPPVSSRPIRSRGGQHQRGPCRDDEAGVVALRLALHGQRLWLEEMKSAHGEPNLNTERPAT